MVQGERAIKDCQPQLVVNLMMGRFIQDNTLISSKYEEHGSAADSLFMTARSLSEVDDRHLSTSCEDHLAVIMGIWRFKTSEQPKDVVRTS